MPETCKHTHPDNPGRATTPGVVFDRVGVSLGGVSLLNDVSACVPLGGSAAIVGPNGAGKTTLIRALLGQVSYKGTISIKLPGERIGYVPQRLDFDRDLPLTVMEFMVLGGQRRPLWFGTKRTQVELAKENLAAVGVEKLAGRRLGALSGGELQRVMLALAIQQKPQLLVLDEPAAGIDAEGEQIICELLEKLQARFGFTQLMVSHDLGTVSHHADHVICLNRTVIAEGPPRDVFTPDNLAAMYGVHMGVLGGVFPARHGANPNEGQDD